MSQESDITGPLTLWIARLQQKVNALEETSKAAVAGDRQKLLKEIDACDTYWKKIYVRAKDFVFPTPQGAQMVRDLASIQEQLTLIRQNVRKREPWHPFSWDQWPTFFQAEEA